MSHLLDRWRRLALHSVRCVLFSSILLVMHLQQRQLHSTVESEVANQINLHQVQQLFPAAVSIGQVDQSGQGREVVDEAGRVLGSVLQTSPAADKIIGYCGPSNVMIALDQNGRIKAIRLLESFDTRDHVSKVRSDKDFHRSFVGWAPSALAQFGSIDTVSGATLTSLAIQESIALRLSGTKRSLRFREEIEVADIQDMFPDAKSIDSNTFHPSIFQVFDPDKQPLGSIVRTSPAADSFLGYQGPTETLIGLDLQGHIIAIAVGLSYDNEPYVTYVRDDEYFNHLFDGKTLDDLAVLSLEEAGVEGVSGATMTSMAVAEGIVQAAIEVHYSQQARRNKLGWYGSVASRDIAIIVVVAIGMVVGLTRLRGRRWARYGLNGLVVVYLGLISGELLSLSLIGGWAQHGIAWRHGLGFVVLALAAFLVPITKGSNIYCNHLCPHGVLQQWIHHVSPRHFRLPGRLARILAFLPWVLLVVAIGITMRPSSIDLVDLEAFDAWHFGIAGSAAIIIGIAGLIASAFSPMAYCRYGCPTGAILKYVRINARSGKWARRDWAAVGLLGVAMILWLI